MDPRLPHLLAAAGAALALSGCGARAEKATLPPAGAVARAVRVAKPSGRIETGLARATGTVRAREDAVLSARATGQIARLLVGVGSRVRRGQPLVEMDATNARIGLQNAQAMERLAAAGLAMAERDMQRSKGLHAEGSLPDAAWEKVQTARDVAAAQHDQARAALRGAEQLLSDMTLTAPFDGTVTARHRNAGDTVTLMPVSPIFSLTDLDHLEVRLAVPEAIEGFARPGQQATGVTTPGGQQLQVKLRVKNGVVDPASRTIEVLADVLQVAGPALRPGTLVQVDLGTFSEKGALFVPTTALRTDGKETYVLVAQNGKAERRPVEATPVHPGTMEVRRGLDATADVILDPGSLAAGDAVVPLAN
ncbi:MAG: efflux RND transporter periplasmic adaptor subunit [Deltaproteobacteria bacterium]|nr:efflux RND transporter periplasmic adaptor subunit [Deltaproteobacteria bacterium]